MILNRRINLIWYGRGNIENECVAFALHNVTEVSTAISEVYCVTDGGSTTSFAENTWKTSKPSAPTGFTHLKCGNLYVVVLNDGQTIDIPEAVVVYGGESVNPADIVSVLPNNDGGTDPEPEPEPTGDCTPDNLYTNASIANGEITINASNYGINTQIASMNVSNDVTFSYRGSLTVGDTGSGVNFLFNGGQLLQINGISSLTFEHPLYIEFRNLTVTNGGTTTDYSGCYKSTLVSGTEANIAIELVSGNETDERTPTPSPSHTVTPDTTDTTVTQLTCFADNDSAEYRMVYEAPVEATSATEVTTDNVKVYRKGSGVALSDNESNLTDATAVKLKDEVVDKATFENHHTGQGNTSKHSFCYWFNVRKFAGGAVNPSDNVVLKSNTTDNGINATDTNFMSVASNEIANWDGQTGNNANMQIIGDPKIWVESSTGCVTTVEGEGDLRNFNF